MNTPTDVTPPEDHEARAPLHFIRTELAARAGVVTTGATTWLSFVDAIDPILSFFIKVVGALVGVATLAYYVPMAILKWREVLRRYEE